MPVENTPQTISPVLPAIVSAAAALAGVALGHFLSLRTERIKRNIEKRNNIRALYQEIMANHYKCQDILSLKGAPTLFDTFCWDRVRTSAAIYQINSKDKEMYGKLLSFYAKIYRLNVLVAAHLTALGGLMQSGSDVGRALAASTHNTVISEIKTILPSIEETEKDFSKFTIDHHYFAGPLKEGKIWTILKIMFAPRSK